MQYNTFNAATTNDMALVVLTNMVRRCDATSELFLPFAIEADIV